MGGTSKYVGAAQAAGAMPLLTLYAIPHRDCGSYAAGGFGSGAAYRGWIDSISADWAGRRHDHRGARRHRDGRMPSPDQRQERFDLLRYAVETLTRDPAAVVYIDGGHSRWMTPRIWLPG